jgi:Pycsar effector protein
MGEDSEDVKATRELAILMFQHIEGQIGRANAEAQVTLAVDAILVAAITTILSNRLGISVLPHGLQDSIFGPHSTVFDQVKALSIVLAIFALLASLFIALAVIRPSLRPPKKHDDGLLFFGLIAKYKDPEKYTTDFKRRNRDKSLDDVLGQVHAKAKIARKKFIGVSISVLCLMAALLLWTVVAAIVAKS